MTVDTDKLKVRCPNCKNWARWKDNPHRPFCSADCRGADLGNWATERYRIPEVETSEIPEDAPAPKKSDNE